MSMIGYSIQTWYNVIFKIVNFVAIWILVFRLNLAIFVIKHISFEELL